MNILDEDASNEIITWTRGGTAFRVHDKSKLSVDVLPRYFGEAEYRSFTRRLLRWGFKRISRGDFTGAFEHKVSKQYKFVTIFGWRQLFYGGMCARCYYYGLYVYYCAVHTYIILLWSFVVHGCSYIFYQRWWTWET
jgi:hypothetical protein